jgi:DNA-binding response OmpR family regulator
MRLCRGRSDGHLGGGLHPLGLTDPPPFLVVEDDPELRQYLIDVLESGGIAAIGVESGERALEHVAVAPVAGVLADLHLPGIDGIELVKLLRHRRPTAAVPMLLLTADGDTHPVEALDAGADDHLQKPLAPAELLARVNAHLRARRR